MVKKGVKQAHPTPVNPENEQKERLRSHAISKRILRRTPANPSAPLVPSKSVLKLEGHDIVKRGQRKSRYLFSFPGLLAPLSAGRIGELADLSTKNPTLYLEFPYGRMKLFGTHVYPKNKYLTLQMTKSAKGVVCEDCFESLIVFSEAWWIGLKEENPEERQLEFPKDINENKLADLDFKGGAGATSEEASRLKRPSKEIKEESSTPDNESDEDMDEDSYPSNEKHVKSEQEATPVRQSARVAGKARNYAESSSGNDSIASDAEVPEAENGDTARTGNDDTTRRSILGDLEDSVSLEDSFLTASGLHDSASEFVDKNIVEQSSSLKRSKKAKEDPPSKKGTLVQATLSTLFDKAAEKKSMPSTSRSPGRKGSSLKQQGNGSKEITEQVQVKVSNKRESNSGKKRSGTITKSVKKQSQVLDDETYDISSDTQKSMPSTSRSPGRKGSSVKRQGNGSKEITEQVQAKVSNKRESTSGKKRSGTITKSVKKQSQVLDDETDDISSDTQDDTDEDWEM